jgi:1-acyl-sn-glycerol-3-phosphate acyltransferase
MKLLKEIFGRAFALWALLTFTVTMLVFLVPFFLLCYFLPEPKRTYRFIAFARVWMGVWLTIIGCPLTIRGREQFAPGMNYIVLCNHNSFMDVPVSSPSIPGGNKTIAKVEMAKIPLFGLLYTAGSVLVDRKNDSSRKDSFNKMKKVLAMGLHMCIYPEGTRNKTDKPLKSFHSGAFRLAVDTKKSIIPACIFNTRKVLPTHKFFYLMPHRLSIHFLPPVEVTENSTAEELQEKVFEIMRLYYVKNAVEG